MHEVTQHRRRNANACSLSGARPTQILQKQVLLGPRIPAVQIALPRVSPRQTLFARSGERRSCLFERPLGLHFRRLVCRVAALREYSRWGVDYIRSPFRKAYLCAIAVRLHSFVDPLYMVYTCDRYQGCGDGYYVFGVVVQSAANLMRLHAAKGLHRPAST